MAEGSPYVSYKENPKAYMRAYYLANKEKLDNYYKENKHKYIESQKEQRKARLQANPNCERERLAQWRLENPDRPKETKRLWRKKNPEKDRRIKLRAMSGITPEQFDAMAISQGYACAICRIVPAYTLHIDHDHKTGKVRGLLCSQCNTGIGCLKESAEFLTNAIKYLSI